MKLKNIPFSYSFRNLWTRKLTTFLTAGGIALVVFVFAAVLMLAYGLEKTLITTGSDENAIILRRGAESEIMSMIDRNQTHILLNQPEIKIEQDRPLATAEAVVLINLPKRGTHKPSNVQIRGVSEASLAMRSQVRLVAGRLWRQGSSEIIVGTAVAKRFQGIGLGETVHFGMREWTVVGLFNAQGSGFESEIWLDADQLLQSFRRSIFSSVTLQLASPAIGFERLKERLENDPRLNVEVKGEKQYYSDQSRMMATFIRVLGIFVTIVFSIGAVIGAMITMYAAVANRTVEIGTLRALGFSRTSILQAFLLESLFLSFLGGSVGLILASLLQTTSISTTNFATFSELAFRFSLSPSILIASIVFSLLMGLFGGVLPAARAARQNIVKALRAT